MALSNDVAELLQSICAAIEESKQTALPFVTLTYAQSLDGCIAHKDISRLHLSGPKSYAMTHGLRARHDAILVGIGTLLSDDPRLNVRLVEGKDPLPVVLDSQLRTPGHARVVARAAQAAPGVGLVVFTTPGGDSAKAQRRAALEALPGVAVREVEAERSGYVAIEGALRLLKTEFAVSSVMVEGGARVIASFLSTVDLVSRLLLTIAPCVVGGLAPATAFGQLQNRGGSRVLPALGDVQMCRIDADCVICGKPQAGQMLPEVCSNGTVCQADATASSPVPSGSAGRRQILVFDLPDGCLDLIPSANSSGSTCNLQHWYSSGLKAAASVGDKKVASFHDKVFNSCGDPWSSASQAQNSSGMHHKANLGEILRSAPCGMLVVPNSLGAWYVDQVLVELGMSEGWPAQQSPLDREAPIDWTSLQKRYPADRFEFVLVADAKEKLTKAADSAGLRGVLVCAECPLERAVLVALDCVPASPVQADAYLAAKQSVDSAAINSAVRSALVDALRAQRGNATNLRVLDVGAGCLSMLQPVVQMAAAAGYAELEYVALERLTNLLDCAAESLCAQGLSRAAQHDDQRMPGFHAAYSGHLTRTSGVHIRLSMLTLDFATLSQADLRCGWPSSVGEHADIGLLVACGFADLIAPDVLSAQLHRLAPGALCWMPITFAGRTWFEPALEGDTIHLGANVPNDTVVADAYHRHLVEIEAQHIDPAGLHAALTARGARQVARGDSDWIIDPTRDVVMWDAMMRFIGIGAPARLWPKWSAAAWFRHRHAERPIIKAANEDLLYELAAEKPRHCAPIYTALSFKSPYTVEVVSRRRSGPLGSADVELLSVCSLISSGTELKFYRGDFDANEGESLDSTIAGMDNAISYPMDYGYCLCGRVAAVGSTADPALLGKLAFAFHAHASSAIVAASSLLLVPDGISPEDVVYLPSVETALSIVHDAHPRAGERVLVLGQGLIGLLVTWILARMFVHVEVVDPVPERLALARNLGAESTWLSGDSGLGVRFDVSVEVSSSARALQTAVDHTVEGGRVVIASWYSGQLPLQLGTRFHRSHITLIASQVSALPAAVSATWSKQRRFDVAWHLLRDLKPSKHMTTLSVPLEKAHEAYAALDSRVGGVIAAEIKYEQQAECLEGWTVA